MCRDGTSWVACCGLEAWGGGGMTDGSVPSEQDLQVFISYSRKDLDFANKLVAALDSIPGFDPLIDREDILPGEPWQERLRQLIVKAGTVVCAISPNSVASKHVAWEVEEAVSLSKRLIPVVACEVDDSTVGERLRHLNYIFFTGPGHSFDSGFAQLVRTLNTDIAWIREHVRLGEQANRWQQNSRIKAQLLRGRDIGQARAWIASRPDRAPEMTPEVTSLQREFIDESASAETLRRRLLAVAAFALAALAGFGLWRLHLGEVENAKSATSLARQAMEDGWEGYYDRTMRMALQGLPAKYTIPFLSPWSYTLEGILANAAVHSRLLAQINDDASVLTAFSDDGHRVITVSSDSARLWDTSTGREQAAFTPNEEVLTATFTPSGVTVLTSSEDNYARVWELATGKKVKEFDLGYGGSHSACLSPRGSRFVISNFSRFVISNFDNTGQLWDENSGNFFPISGDPNGNDWDCAFSSDGATLITSGGQFSHSSSTGIWDATTGNQISMVTGYDYNAEWRDSLSPDRKKIVVIKGDTAKILDATTKEVIKVLGNHQEKINSAAFNRDGSQVVTASDDRTARVWDAVSGAEIESLKHRPKVYRAHFSRDATKIVTVSFDATWLWDAATGHLFAVLEGHEGEVTDAKFSPDGTRILTTSDDGTARLWNAVDNSHFTLLNKRGRDVYEASFSTDGTKVVIISENETAEVWDVATGDAITAFHDHAKDVLSATFSNNGVKVVTTSKDRTARVWDAATGNPIAVLEGHRGDVIHAAFDSEGRRVVTASKDKTARVWDAMTGSPLAVLEGHGVAFTSVAFSPDGSKVLTTSKENTLSKENTMRIWDAGTGREIGQIGHYSHNVDLAVFSKDGKRIAAASGKKVRIWDIANEHGDPLSTLEGHTYEVTSLAFSADGTRILTAAGGRFSGDKTVRLWDVTSGAEIAVLNGDYAVLTSDEAKVTTISSQGGLLSWDVTWATKVRAKELRDRVCAEKLTGAESFSAGEAKNPILNGLAGKSPCDRRGPLSVRFWINRLAASWQWASAFFNGAEAP